MANGSAKVEQLQSESVTSKVESKNEVRANRCLHKVVPVRLPEEKWELMRKEADALGIGPTTLARIWILDSLRKKARRTEP